MSDPEIGGGLSAVESALDILAIGATSAMGLDVPSHIRFWEGDSSVLEEEFRPDIENVNGPLRVCSAGEFDVRPFLRSPKTAKFLTREMRLALYSAAQVRGQLPPLDTDRIGVVLATAPALSSIPDIAGIQERCVVDGVLQPSLLAADLPMLMPATWPCRSLKATAACHLAAELDVIGPNLTLSPRPLSGLTSICIAELLLSSGAADIILVGAADSRIDHVSIAEAVTRRRARLGVNQVHAENFVAGFNEGAVILALARPGEYIGTSLQFLASQEIHLRPEADGRELAREFANILESFRIRAGTDHFHSIWVDQHPDFASLDLTSDDLVTNPEQFDSMIDIRREFGEFGIATSSIALAAVCAQNGADHQRPSIVVSVGENELLAVMIGKQP